MKEYINTYTDKYGKEQTYQAKAVDIQAFIEMMVKDNPDAASYGAITHEVKDTKNPYLSGVLFDGSVNVTIHFSKYQKLLQLAASATEDESLKMQLNEANTFINKTISSRSR